MAKAGVILKQVLEAYGITQSELARVMGIRRSSVHRWVNELADPVSDAIIDIRDALEKINSEASAEFVRLWLDKSDRKEAE
ncbi:MAG: helix-turn-helix transcriptional regulator [Leptolyngbyaceae cyanobacterium SL_5_9]|nr:helix-turn-helix transcriptional regulator [Leptolyngbyaceae cyanobacterium SL_5_9]